MINILYVVDSIQSILFEQQQVIFMCLPMMLALIHGLSQLQQRTHH
jgi:hypothetical protein